MSDEGDAVGGRSDPISLGAKLSPAVQVGKGGLSPGVVKDMRDQLKAHRLIKVKIVPRMDREDVRALAEDAAEKTGSSLLQVKGRTFLLYRERGGR